jgi:predicted secreted hydrolase
MKRIQEIMYSKENHGDFNYEWFAHKEASEWWYATGLLTDDSGKLFSYQFVIIKSYLKVMEIWSTQLALTDFETGKHYYFDENALNNQAITIDNTSAIFSNISSVIKSEDSMRIIGKAKDFSFDIECNYGKGAFWHCDNGFLLMGTPTTNQTTSYYSYTNMPSNGTVTINGKEINVKGNSWFDKQGGTFDQTSNKTQWEWFSFRFFDNEEIMLFTFPQNNYYDGTYIKANTAERLNNYTVKTTKVVNIDGLEFSSKWDVTIPGVKDENYTLVPLLDCQRNGSYFELVAKIINKEKTHVGYCVVELLPGVRNKNHTGDLSKLA